MYAVDSFKPKVKQIENRAIPKAPSPVIARISDPLTRRLFLFFSIMKNGTRGMVPQKYRKKAIVTGDTSRLRCFVAGKTVARMNITKLSKIGHSTPRVSCFNVYSGIPSAHCSEKDKKIKSHF